MALYSALLHRLRDRLSGRDRPLRFLFAGGLNTVFGLAVYPSLLWSSRYLHKHYMLGLVLAQAMSLVFAFTVYKIIVFQSRNGVAREFSRFLPFYLANYAVSLLALPLLVKSFRLDPVFAQFGFSIFVMVTSYIWHSRVTFRPAKVIR